MSYYGIIEMKDFLCWKCKSKMLKSLGSYYCPDCTIKDIEKRIKGLGKIKEKK